MRSNAYNFYNFKTALYSSAVVMKGFTSSKKVVLAEIITVKLRIRPLTFINEALRLSGSPFVACTVSP